MSLTGSCRGCDRSRCAIAAARDSSLRGRSTSEEDRPSLRVLFIVVVSHRIGLWARDCNSIASSFGGSAAVTYVTFLLQQPRLFIAHTNAAITTTANRV